MKSFFVYLILVMWMGVKSPWFATFFCLYFLFTKSIPLKKIFVLVFVLFILRSNIHLCQTIDQGRIVRLNRSSVLVHKGFTKVMVQVHDVSRYAMHDQITLYALHPIEANMNQDGFDPIDWAKANGVCYRTQEADTHRTEGKGIVHRLSKGGPNADQRFVQEIRALLFQSDPDEAYHLWVSMGLVYLAILNLIKRLCIRFKSIWVERIVSIAVLGVLSAALGMPLVLVRILITYLVGMFIEDRMLKWALSIFLCLWIVPYGSTQLAFLFPFSLQATAVFVDKKAVRWVRACVVFWCLLTTLNRVSLLGLLLFPIQRVLHLILIGMGVLSAFIPFIQNSFSFVYQMLDRFYIHTQSVLIIRGRGSVLLVFLFVIVWHRLKNKHIVIRTFALCVNNMLLIMVSYPWFYTVTMLYVGQGDAILLQAPFNQSVILIDSGPPSQYANLKASLDHRGIHTIHTLIITHDDLDHTGNIASLTQDYDVKAIVQHGGDIQDAWFYLKHLPIQDAREDNERSLVYRLQINSTRFLFMGDLGVAGELQLIRTNPELASDILKVGHHGSKTSSSLAFLERVRARIAWISAGKNSYGHPNGEVIERLERLAMRPVVSQMSGTVQIVITPWFRFMRDRFNRFTLF